MSMLKMRTKRFDLVWRQATITVVGFFLCIMASRGCQAEAVGGADTVTVQLETQLGHLGAITSAVFSPDGRTVLTAGPRSDKTARLWEAATGRELRRFEGHENQVMSAVFSPDGRKILTSSDDRTARLWDTATGRELRRFERDEYGVTLAIFSPDGRTMLTANRGKTARLWDTATGRELRRFERDEPHSAVFSPDGSTILILGFFAGTLWETATGRELRRFEGHEETVRSAIFSFDGSTILTSSDDGTARLWETATGRELRRFKHESAVNSAVFSSDGSRILTSSYDKTAYLWETTTGRELRRFKGHVGDVMSAVFSPDGSTILTSSTDETAYLWETTTGRELRRFKGRSAMFSPDGRKILTLGLDTALLWETDTGRELQRFEGNVDSVRSAVFSSDGSKILTSSSDTAHLWDMGAGRELRRFEFERQHRDSVMSAVFSPDGRKILTSSDDKTARLWDTATGRELRRLEGHEHLIRSAAFSPDGTTILTSSDDGAARLWETATGREVRRLERHAAFDSAIFSSDGSKILTSGSGSTARLWETATGRELRRFEGHRSLITSAVLSPDGHSVLTANSDYFSKYDDAHDARLLDATTGNELRRFTGHRSGVRSVAFSPDGSKILTSSADVALLLETGTGRELRRFEGYGGEVYSAVFSTDGRIVLIASEDRILRLWDSTTGEELARLVSFSNGDWVVGARRSRFDTNNLEVVKALYWLAADEPLHALPVEIFMRDYYEPQLLPQLLSGKQLPKVRSLADLNRAQPEVRIVDVKVDDARLGLATVTVEVKGSVKTVESTKKRWVSGAYDLRLFRDGQLVGQYPQPEAGRGSLLVSTEEELEQWQKDHEIKLEGGEQGRFERSFQVRLPRRTDVKEVEFSAYAFNADRVKSETRRRTLPMPEDIEPRAGRAYVVTVGVNASKNPAWDLNYAANDAQVLGETLAEQLKSVRDENTGKARFDEQDVVWVKLVSTVQNKEGKREFPENNATKDKIRAVLEKLSGKAVDRKRLQGIVGVERLEAVRPEDVVILAFSTHGYTDRAGRFYLLPQDVGTVNDKFLSDKLEAQVLPKAISSDDLTEWLREVDAGEMVMIVDACYSAASVESGEFKPGPLGSRGLGQLAYDKGMRILVASQKDAVAREPDKLQMGYLSYALAKDGLERGNADFKPEDKRILLSEWLAWAVDRVPKLYKAVQDGTYKDKDIGLRKIGVGAVNSSAALAQQPILFDFARKRDFTLQLVEP